jgi:hypothetical protein
LSGINHSRKFESTPLVQCRSVSHFDKVFLCSETAHM